MQSFKVFFFFLLEMQSSALLEVTVLRDHGRQCRLVDNMWYSADKQARYSALETPFLISTRSRGEVGYCRQRLLQVAICRRSGRGHVPSPGLVEDGLGSHLLGVAPFLSVLMLWIFWYPFALTRSLNHNYFTRFLE